VRRKRPELWQSGEWWLHHDNVPAHKALIVKQFLTNNSMIQLQHPPYSPDLTLCDFFLFARIKRVLKGKRFADVDEAEKKTTEALKCINLQEFQDCFDKWKTRLDRCVASNGQYCEGD
jgi:histone-lysine N-methyltransferase SETMAR